MISLTKKKSRLIILFKKKKKTYGNSFYYFVLAFWYFKEKESSVFNLENENSPCPLPNSTHNYNIATVNLKRLVEAKATESWQQISRSSGCSTANPNLPPARPSPKATYICIYILKTHYSPIPRKKIKLTKQNWNTMLNQSPMTPMKGSL